MSRKGRSSSRSLLVTLVAAITMAGGIALFKFRAGAPAGERPGVRLEPATMDLGVVPSRAKVENAFLLKNPGLHPMTVRKVSTDCGCFVPEDLAGTKVVGRGEIAIPFRFAASVQGKFERMIFVELQQGQIRSVVSGTVQGVSLPESGFFSESGLVIEMGILFPGESRKAVSRLVGRPDVLQRLTFSADSPEITVSASAISEPANFGGLERMPLEIVVARASGGASAGRVMIHDGENRVGSIAVRWDPITNDRKAVVKRFLGVIPPGSAQEIDLEGIRIPDEGSLRGNGVEIVRIIASEPPALAVRFPNDAVGLYKASVEYVGESGRPESIELTASLKDPM